MINLKPFKVAMDLMQDGVGRCSLLLFRTTDDSINECTFVPGYFGTNHDETGQQFKDTPYVSWRIVQHCDCQFAYDVMPDDNWTNISKITVFH